MKTTYSALRLVALLCVAMVLLAVLVQPVFGLLLVLLIPFWFVLAIVVSAPLPLMHCSSIYIVACFLSSPAPQ